MSAYCHFKHLELVKVIVIPPGLFTQKETCQNRGISYDRGLSFSGNAKCLSTNYLHPHVFHHYSSGLLATTLAYANSLSGQR